MHICVLCSKSTCRRWASYPKHFPLAERNVKSGVDKNDSLSHLKCISFHKLYVCIYNNYCFILLPLWSRVLTASVCLYCSVRVKHYQQTVGCPPSRWHHCAMICWRFKGNKCQATIVHCLVSQLSPYKIFWSQPY